MHTGRVHALVLGPCRSLIRCQMRCEQSSHVWTELKRNIYINGLNRSQQCYRLSLWKGSSLVFVLSADFFFWFFFLVKNRPTRTNFGKVSKLWQKKRHLWHSSHSGQVVLQTSSAAQRPRRCHNGDPAASPLCSPGFGAPLSTWSGQWQGRMTGLWLGQNYMV